MCAVEELDKKQKAEEERELQGNLVLLGKRKLSDAADQEQHDEHAEESTKSNDDQLVPDVGNTTRAFIAKKKLRFACDERSPKDLSLGMKQHQTSFAGEDEHLQTQRQKKHVSSSKSYGKDGGANLRHILANEGMDVRVPIMSSTGG